MSTSRRPILKGAASAVIFGAIVAPCGAHAVFQVLDGASSKAFFFTLKANGSKYQEVLSQNFDQLLSWRRYAEASTDSPPERVRAVVTEQDKTNPEGKRYPGRARWRTEKIPPGPLRVVEQLAVRADIEVPERKLAMTWLLYQSLDKSLQASYIIEVSFDLPSSHPGGGIFNVLNVTMKHDERERGVELTAAYIKARDTLFVIVLPEVQDDSDRRNIHLLKERSWFEIAVLYNNKRSALIAFEKGASGEDAFKKWSSHKSP